MTRSMARLETSAPAKVNLTLRVLARRADGYHELTSLVAFAAIGDTLALDPDMALDLMVDGPSAAGAGPMADNLVLKAAHALAARIEGLQPGRFSLTKRLPAGAGLGGGSADAAAALRLLAQAHGLTLDDRRLLDAARAVGADVPVCLDPRARLMHGIGERLSPPLKLPKLDAVLVYPAVPLATADVFRVFAPAGFAGRKTAYSESEIPRERVALLRFLAREANDLEPAACALAPAVAEARELLARAGTPRIVRMTGSGSAMFAIHDDANGAENAAAEIGEQRPGWWVAATTLG